MEGRQLVQVETSNWGLFVERSTDRACRGGAGERGDDESLMHKGGEVSGARQDRQVGDCLWGIEGKTDRPGALRWCK